jgi:hypothetical protein
MRATRTRRVPLLLLALLVATLLFPRALDRAALAVAAWLPAEAPSAPPPRSLPEEERARLLQRISRLEDDAAARPAADGALGPAAVVARRDREPARLLPARLLRHDLSPSRRSFLIDAGSDDGVRSGMAVIQGDSLVGVVGTVVARAARVLRVDDRDTACALPATVLAADGGAETPVRGQGVARGAGDGTVRVAFLNPGGASAGDLVVTGAGAGLVPEGLLLGVVLDVTDADRDGADEAVLQPLRNLDGLGTVLVVLAEAPGLGVGSR